MRRILGIWGVCLILSACSLDNAEIGHPETFVKFFDFGEGFNVKQTTDEGFICVGTYDNGAKIEAHLIKTDDAGNVEWLQRFENYRGRSVAEVSGGYIFVGDAINTNVGVGEDPITTMAVVLTNTTGDITDTLSIGDNVNNYGAQTFTFDTNGSLLVLGVFEDASSYEMLLLTKVDITSGSLTRDWTKTYGTDQRNNKTGISIHQNTTGEIIWSGSVATQDEGQSFLKVYAVEPFSEAANGSTQGENSTDKYTANDIQPIGSNFAIIGTRNDGTATTMYFIKVDHFGNIIPASERSFDDASIEQLDATADFEGVSLCSTFDSGLILLGTRSSPVGDPYGKGELDYILIKTDNSGNPVWWKIIGGIGDEFGGTVIEALDNSIVIFGTTRFQNTSRMTLIKTTSKGVIY